ncbi:hypothetical protein A2865_03555 [Candidatus Woesebacteria bacterium RIFCSPHIGHO2_01_FULL_39_17]|uniref:SCP domain-containing protein n=3 Tax=Candidatus Woeseibacteriota TaxID=1752722 RepID=A0A0G0QVF4_9BACT|nr:MAG: hypothetical protein US72_C0007G0027 [Microgenomates group bacterium GW2011_GWC1_38_12]KKQ93772.1 MAG: hypothetical protein UT19_C0007G0016 [Candidatus Woesebacteria bacterium GW2011_GWB1_39_10b]KKR14335.1 MAG: hypothetical protein UT40_C0002G0014 [Candidatus Woesebacteria bacterium GW2011_GWA1_39_21b]OGM23608.1 MAG: hypothetical protein A2865_03555 [Candidatus Woesebacteria bacterium RIFCSPHIGHO2_01_FULL_39_17]OGM64344.1 MAG: hypothetical protein A3A52_05410 [Candidatus Woesebacteria b
MGIRFSIKIVLKTFLTIFALVLFFASLLGVYFLGMVKGYKMAQKETEADISSFLEDFIEKQSRYRVSPTPTLVPTRVPSKTVSSQVSWGGPELWAAVNKKRVELGVNPLTQRDELCTIASIRLNELLELGKLDGHVGFSNLEERRTDLKWIFDKYGNMAEFLAVGGKTPEETVSLWENTLGHKKLLTGGEYVWGCIYAQNTFSVAITAF